MTQLIDIGVNLAHRRFDRDRDGLTGGHAFERP
jgi:hypothetical protein